VRKDGSPCERGPLKGSEQCWNCDKKSVEKRAEARRRGLLAQKLARLDAAIEAAKRFIADGNCGADAGGKMLDVLGYHVRVMTTRPLSEWSAPDQLTTIGVVSEVARVIHRPVDHYRSGQSPHDIIVGTPNTEDNTSQGEYSLTYGHSSRNDPANGPPPPVDSQPQKRPKKKKIHERKSPSVLSAEQQERFARFWAVYPRRVKRVLAEKAWAKHKPDEQLTRRIVRAVELQILHTWRDAEMDKIPHPTSWLNAERWDDEIQTTIPNPRAETQGRRRNRAEDDINEFHRLMEIRDAKQAHHDP